MNEYISALGGQSLPALIAICTSFWYISSNFNAIATQVLFTKLNSNEQGVQLVVLAQLLTTLQLVVGTVFSITFFSCRHLLYGNLQGNGMQLFHKKVRIFDAFVGILHYAGSMCTNMGFACGSASLVQCVKLLEPIETLLFLVLAILLRDKILSKSWDATKLEIQQIVSIRKVSSTFVIIGGTTLLLTQKSMDPNPKSIIYALVSGFCMASRNVLKKTTSQNNTDIGGGQNEAPRDNAFVTGVHSFTFITTVAAIPALAVTLMCCVHNYSSQNSLVLHLFKSESGASEYLGRAVAFHCLYNVFSITVLSLTSATTHSLMNVGKRIVNVLASAVYFGTSLSMSGKVGISLAAVGAFIYNDTSTEVIKNTPLGKYLARDVSENRIKTKQPDLNLHESKEREENPLIDSGRGSDIRMRVV